jgi:large subunit ribosomal protein L19
MNNKIEKFLRPLMNKNLPDVRPGDTVRIYQKITAPAASTSGKKTKDAGKEKSQVFEGRVLAVKHGRQMGSTLTLRKVVSGVGVERIFPLYSPAIEKIEVVKKGRPGKAKLYYLRTMKARKRRLNKREVKELTPQEQPVSEETPQ